MAIVLLLSLIVLLPGLGNQFLWQDEAQTALIAGTVLTGGIPLGYDGKNFFSQELGREYSENYIWRWQPWLPFYVLAAFFAILGKSTFAARLPFALFGIATTVLAYRFAATLWQSRRAGFFAALVLLMNVPFLLLTRQCRHYAPIMFFDLLSLYGYCSLLERKKYSGVIFVLSAIALFQSHYVHYAALMAAVITHAILFHRNRLKAVLISVGLTVAVNAPWIIWYSALSDIVTGPSDITNRAVAFAKDYLWKIGKYAFPPLLLLAPMALWAIGRSKWRKPQFMTAVLWQRLILLLLFFTATLTAVCLTSPYPFFRYIAPLVPVSSIVISLILDRVAAAHRIAGTIAAIIMLASLGLAWSVPDYFYEVTHDYNGPIEGIVKYIEKHAYKDDVVAMTYGDLPVKFYTGLRVIGGLTGEDLTPARNADWIVIRKHIICEKDMEVHNFLVSQVPFEKYDAITIDSPDLPFENREEPDLHLFRTAEDDRVVILHRRDSPSR